MGVELAGDGRTTAPRTNPDQTELSDLILSLINSGDSILHVAEGLRVRLREQPREDSSGNMEAVEYFVEYSFTWVLNSMASGKNSELHDFFEKLWRGGPGNVERPGGANSAESLLENRLESLRHLLAVYFRSDNLLRPAGALLAGEAGPALRATLGLMYTSAQALQPQDLVAGAIANDQPHAQALLRQLLQMRLVDPPHGPEGYQLSWYGRSLVTQLALAPQAEAQAPA
jgi:hypothetical protein